jgi:adenylylsulfate kinase-like enzyme
MSNNELQSLMPIELIHSVMDQVDRDPRAMVAVIGMFTNAFAAVVAEAIALDDESTKDRCQLIHQQMDDCYQQGEVDGLNWIEDLTLYAREDAKGLFSRAVQRQLKVYAGNHKPYSPTRGEGFGS